MEPSDSLELFPLLMGLIGGLALFLFGMEEMASALKSAAGDRMKGILATLTKNRFMGVVTGAFVTATIQSSSVTTVLVVGFISAGLMSLAQSIGVILGAGIGTTITAQIIAFKVTKYALVLVAVGFGLSFTARKEAGRFRGRALLGLGLVFFGMSVMGESMVPLRSYQPFLLWMSQMEDPLLGILVGTLFTALIQSSSATTGVVIVMASQGLISLPAGIALIFGANIGTCATALLASIGKPREAVRAAVVHIIFKITGVVLWFSFIDELGQLVTWLSPRSSDLTGLDRLSAEAPRQIANAHTIFNVANTLVFLPFSTQFARLVERLVPDRPLAEAETVRARYLDESLLATPSFALDRARLELLHMGDRVRAMMQSALPAVLSGSREDLHQLEELDDAVDALHGHIIEYLGKISQTRLSEKQTAELVRLMAATNDLENIGDIIETNLVRLGQTRVNGQFEISASTQEVLNEFHATVSSALEFALMAVSQRNQRAAQRVSSMKTDINRLADSAALHEAQRLVAEEPNRLAAYTMEMGVLENLKHIYYFTKRIARMTPSVNLQGTDPE